VLYQDLFQFDLTARRARRVELGVEDRTVMVYSGSVGGWYTTDEMAAFFVALKRRRPDAFFLWLTTGSSKLVEGAMKKAGVLPNDYAVHNAESRDVPAYLSASDIGIGFYRPGISRIGTSPVKVSEYLSCGLPVVINAGIGDSDQMVAREKIGALVGGFNQDEYDQAAARIVTFLDQPDQTRTRARVAAGKLFDLRGIGIDRYASLYETLLNPRLVASA
jgi:glycosyltransferase involved in cell wall biosynthesis